MKRTFLIAGAIIVVGIVAAVMYQQRSSTNTATQNAAETNLVTVKDMAFAPATIKVKVGTKVTWTNNDSRTHTVASYDGHIPSSQDIRPGETYSYTFTKTGTFKYHCSIHPNMKGVVVVTD